MHNNAKYNSLRCVRCTSQNNTELTNYREKKLIEKKTAWAPTVQVETRTYQINEVQVPICPNCHESLSKLNKFRKALGILVILSLFAVIIFIAIAIYIVIFAPAMSYDLDYRSFTFEDFVPAIISLIIFISLIIISRILNLSKSNLGNYIKFGDNRVIITPSNSTRSWFLESWNQIVTEEQLEAEKLYITASSFYKEGSYIEAIKLYDKALDLFPEYTDVIHAKNSALFNMKRYIDLITKILEDNQNGYSFKALLTRLNKKIKDRNEKRHIRKILQNILNQMSSNGLINSTSQEGEDYYSIP